MGSLNGKTLSLDGEFHCCCLLSTSNKKMNLSCCIYLSIFIFDVEVGDRHSKKINFPFPFQSVVTFSNYVMMVVGSSPTTSSALL